MIQDIAPEIMDQRYRNEEPSAGDRVLAFDGEMLSVVCEEPLTLPRYEDIGGDPALYRYLFAISGQFNLLTDLAVFSCWTFYTLTFIAVMLYRKQRPDLNRVYKVPLYPVVPLIAILSGIYVIVSQLFLSGTTSRIMAVGSILVTLAGLPVYLMVERHRKDGSGQA